MRGGHLEEGLVPEDPRAAGPYRLLARWPGPRPVPPEHGMYVGRDRAHGHAVVCLLPRAAYRAAEALRRGAVPGVPDVLDLRTGSDPSWLALAYTPAVSLADVARPGTTSGVLAPDQAVRLAGAVADTLAGLHARGIGYGAVAPDGIWLTTGRPLLMALHACRTLPPVGVGVGVGAGAGAGAVAATEAPVAAADAAVAESADGRTRSGARPVAPEAHSRVSTVPAAWMAPEVATGGRSSAAADVYAVAVLLVHSATGRLPFGDGPPPALAYRALHDRPELPVLPGEAGEALAAALSPSAADRPTAAELCRALTPGGADPGRAPGPLPGRVVAALAVRSQTIADLEVEDGGPADRSATVVATFPLGGRRGTVRGNGHVDARGGGTDGPPDEDASAVPESRAAETPSQAPSPAPARSPSPSPARSPSPTRSPAPTPARSPAPTPARSPAPTPAPSPARSPSPAPAPSPAVGPAVAASDAAASSPTRRRVLSGLLTGAAGAALGVSGTLAWSALTPGGGGSVPSDAVSGSRATPGSRVPGMPPGALWRADDNTARTRLLPVHGAGRFLLTRGEVLYAHDLGTGQEAWRLPGVGRLNLPVLAPGDRALMSTRAGLALCSLSDGRTLWLQRYEDLTKVLAVEGTTAWLLVGNGTPYGGNQLAAFDLDQRGETWRSPLPDGFGYTLSVTVGPGAVVVEVPPPDQGVHAVRTLAVAGFDRRTGRMLWNRSYPEVSGGAASAVDPAAGRLFLLARGHAYAYDLTTGARLWESQAQVADTNGPPLLSGGVLCVNDAGRGPVVAVAADTGRTLWEQDLDENLEWTMLGPMVVSSSGRTLFLSTLNQVTATDLASGKRLWQAGLAEGPTAREPFQLVAVPGILLAARPSAVVAVPAD
ncbi:PQQ-binding-like beta-propeller repeat protein [Streptomyces sp. NPDC058622]|uniref:outer membrane protein assembly factor BamB family protein n=1 Tax=Streptomyces sp. NPDC058622 TaxID=3346562 RepID=UPI003646E582